MYSVFPNRPVFEAPLAKEKCQITLNPPKSHECKKTSRQKFNFSGKNTANQETRKHFGSSWRQAVSSPWYILVETYSASSA